MFFSNTLRDCILYSVTENGDLYAKQSKTSEKGSSRSIFQSGGNTAVRANEKIENIYNSLFNAAEQQKEDIAPVKKTMNPTEIAEIAPTQASTTPKLPTRK